MGDRQGRASILQSSPLLVSRGKLSTTQLVFRFERPWHEGSMCQPGVFFRKFQENWISLKIVAPQTSIGGSERPLFNRPTRSLHSLWFYGKSPWNFGEVVGSSDATPSWVKKSLSLDKIGFVVIENLDHDCCPTCQEYCAWDNKICKGQLFHIISDGLMDGWKKHILVLYLNGM